MSPKTTLCLWFNGTALEAATFYAATFPDSAVGRVMHAPGDYPAGHQGDVLTVEFTVLGIPCLGLNGGPAFKYSEAFLFQIATDDQAETDRLWEALAAGGGSHGPCGWLKDRYGLSWQVVPEVVTALMTTPDKARAERVLAAVMQMGKIDIATVEAAAREAA